jgi:PBP1b-binding outer membrane lipoprotein LpoB
MKTKLIIVLAAVAMLFTSCGKDKDPGKNTVTYDGVTYEVTPSVQLDDYDPNYAYLSAISGKVMFGVPLFNGLTQKNL